MTMEVERIIEVNQEYRELASSFDGIEITFRHYFSDNLVLIKIDDNFARANGYKSLSDLAAMVPELCKHEWADASGFRLIAEHEEWYAQQLKN